MKRMTLRRPQIDVILRIKPDKQWQLRCGELFWNKAKYQARLSDLPKQLNAYKRWFARQHDGSRGAVNGEGRGCNAAGSRQARFVAWTSPDSRFRFGDLE